MHPLKKFMEDNKLEQQEVAQHFGRTRQTIAKWLNGDGSPTQGDFAKFWDYWGKVHTTKLCLSWIEYERNSQ